MRADPELAIPEDSLEPLAELLRSAITRLALWWSERPEVPRARVVRVAVELLTRGLGLDAERS